MTETRNTAAEAIAAIPGLVRGWKARTIRKVMLRLLPILAMAYFPNSLEKTNIGLATLQMKQALGVTTAASGSRRGCFSLAMQCLRSLATSCHTRSGRGNGSPAS